MIDGLACASESPRRYVGRGALSFDGQLLMIGGLACASECAREPAQLRRRRGQRLAELHGLRDVASYLAEAREVARILALSMVDAAYHHGNAAREAQRTRQHACSHDHGHVAARRAAVERVGTSDDTRSNEARIRTRRTGQACVRIACCVCIVLCCISVVDVETRFLH